MKYIIQTVVYYLLLWPLTALANASNGRHASGIGAIANNIMEPVTVLANFIGTMSIVLGISFLFGAFFKYSQYRINPLATPLSTVVLLLIMGIILLAIPFAYRLTESGFPILL